VLIRPPPRAAVTSTQARRSGVAPLGKLWPAPTLSSVSSIRCETWFTHSVPWIVWSSTVWLSARWASFCGLSAGNGVTARSTLGKVWLWSVRSIVETVDEGPIRP